MRDGGPDPLERMSDARRIRIERVVSRQNIKWHDQNVLAAETAPTRSNGGWDPSPTGRWCRGCAAPILLPSYLSEGTDMPGQTQDALIRLSDALAARTAAAAGLVASIHAPHARPRSGILWRRDVVAASEQVFPKAESAEIVV